MQPIGSEAIFITLFEIVSISPAVCGGGAKYLIGPGNFQPKSFEIVSISPAVCRGEQTIELAQVAHSRTKWWVNHLSDSRMWLRDWFHPLELCQLQANHFEFGSLARQPIGSEAIFITLFEILSISPAVCQGEPTIYLAPVIRSRKCLQNVKVYRNLLRFWHL